jgi:hypothetical protein
MSERSIPALVLTLAAGLGLAQPSHAQTPDRVHVRLSGTGFATPVLADYQGGLASTTELEQDIGATRTPGPGRLRLSNITLRRTQVDNGLTEWRKKVNDGLDFRRDVLLEFVTPGGTTVASFHLFNAWPSSYSIAGSLAPRVPGAAPKTVEAVTLVFDDYSREQ